MDLLEQRTMRKVGRRLIPFLMLCYFFNFLDRVNVSFAALQMNEDLGFSASVFGLGAGILFFTYMICETPSNAILVKVGARVWLARNGALSAGIKLGTEFWATMYIPIVVAMAAQQNVLSAAGGGPMVVIAAVLTVAACAGVVALISRIDKGEKP